MSGGIFWLASYPKSGNTWFRIFLTNLKRASDNPADINALETDGITSSRAMLDDVLGFASADLLPEEIEALRPGAYRWLHNNAGTQISYLKVHDALHTADGRQLFDGGATLGAVYILRNPLDVASSAAEHWNVSIDDAIERMGKRTSALLRRQISLNRQVRQHLSSWSEHVQGWAQHQCFPMCVLRYEDMLHDAEASFGRAARFLKIKHDAHMLRRAIAFSDFRVLAQQEAEKGFHETLRPEQRFFRCGQSAAWLNELSDAQVARIIADHGGVMRQYGYLDADGQPLKIPAHSLLARNCETNMTDIICTLDTRTSRNPDLIAAPMDGDIVMFSVSKGSYYGINQVGVEIWEWLDQPKSLRDLAQNMVSAYEVDEATAESDLQRFILRLLQEDIAQVA